MLTRDRVRLGRHELGMVMMRLVGVKTERSSEDDSGVTSSALSSMATASPRDRAWEEDEWGALSGFAKLQREQQGHMPGRSG
jgi:hypothetical protein